MPKRTRVPPVPTPFVLAALVALLPLAATPVPVAAQAYQSWESPDAPENAGDSAARQRLREFVDRLNRLVDQAEKDRAASPDFLRDLRDLARGYDRPWTVRVLHDTFADGDYTQDPAWTVAQGRYWIEKGWGLRNALEVASAGGGSGGNTEEEQAAKIFGQILNQVLKGRNGQQGGADAKAQPTEIYAPANITNAFAVELEFSSWLDTGALSVGPYQGNDRAGGYRLVYQPNGAIELRAMSPSGQRLVERVTGPFKLEDKQVHSLEWTRLADGTMRASLDGAELFELRDRSFRDPFQGFVMATQGGDFIVKRITVHSVP